MKVITNEIVFRGHPDKLADQISDKILMEYLKQDKNSIVNIEVVGGKGIVFVTGEVFATTHIDIQKTIKDILADVRCCTEAVVIDEVDKKSLKELKYKNKEESVVVYGYACNETEKLLPKGMIILQEIAKEYEKLRKQDERFLSDGKVKMEAVYNNNDELMKINSFIINHQNTGNDVSGINKKMSELIYRITSKYDVEVEDIQLNPYGSYLIGGFDRDTGITGRKLDIDSYQKFAPSCVNTLSGKDPRLPSRSGMYKAREIAKRALKEYNLKWCEIQINYESNTNDKPPIAIIINSERGLLEVPRHLYEECIPTNIVKDLKLLNEDFVSLSSYGHIQK
jgi:S-adenosylmethionine synthetase